MSRWLFFPSPVVAGYLQEITWTMSGASTAAVSSSGQDIINNSKTNQLSWDAGQPRFWNGTESQNLRANASNAFSNGAATRVWWNNYIVEMQFNGGIWTGGAADPVGSSGTQPLYLNTTTTLSSQSGTAFVSGDIIKFRISTAS